MVNWIGELYDLYEKNEHLAGKVEYKVYKSPKGEIRSPVILLPVYHSTVAAQITVVITDNGEFLRAEPVPEEDKLTIIPVSEASASRTSSPRPHPLCDSIVNMAGDYPKYGKDKEGKDLNKNHDDYIKELKKWNESPYTHEKVNAIYQYMEKCTLVKDLININILKCKEDGLLDETVKIQNVIPEKMVVRFQIEKLLHQNEVILGKGEIDDCPKCWLDESLFSSFINYYNSMLTEKELCYLTGNRMQISYLQPRKIRNEADNSKLISAKDDSYAPYVGRFKNKTEAFAVGYESSQKVHNALKWIIRKQGCNWDGLYTVVWESDLLPVPEWNRDTDDVCLQCETLADLLNEDIYEPKSKERGAQYVQKGEVTAFELKKALYGYQSHIKDTSRVVLIAVDAATTGRLALVQFQSLETSSYLKNVEFWHESCEWIHIKYKNGTIHKFSGIVSVKEMTELLYGTEQKGVFSLNGKTRMSAEVCKRILPCIWNKKPVPSDMVRLAVQKASSPVSYEKWYNWEKVLTLACSLVKKQFWDQKKITNKEDWNMAVDTFCRNRDYLYGRLLAVADKIEYDTYEKDDKNRETNAKRYMCAFSQKPFQTWKVIEEKLQPYMQKLELWQNNKYSKLLDEIFTYFTVNEFECNNSLNGLYLLGFHHQKEELWHKTNEQKAESAEDNSGEA